jgi:hypothetical protein
MTAFGKYLLNTLFPSGAMRHIDKVSEWFAAYEDNFLLDPMVESEVAKEARSSSKSSGG